MSNRKVIVEIGKFTKKSENQQSMTIIFSGEKAIEYQCCVNEILIRVTAFVILHHIGKITDGQTDGQTEIRKDRSEGQTEVITIISSRWRGINSEYMRIFTGE